MNPMPKNVSADEQWLESLADSCLPDDIPSTPLRSSASQRSLLKHELTDLFKMEELQKELMHGIGGLHRYCDKMLTPEQNRLLFEELEQFNQKMMNNAAVNDSGTDMVQLFDLSDNVLTTLNEAGASYFKEEDYQTAAGVYTILAMLQHTHPQHLCYRGLCYQTLSRFPEALADFECAFQLSQDPGVLLFMADTFTLAGEKEAALEKMSEAQLLMQHNPDYQTKWSDYYTSLKSALQ